MPWCDPTLSVEARVEDMISRMSLPEKIAALDTAGPGIASLGLDPYNWWSEATHGISHVRNRVQDGTRYESNFAFPITTAMSFNRSLWEATGRRIGIEARAFMNQGDAWSTYWAPVINLAREPRWGRNIETPGEDPYLSGEYATAFVRGLERNPIDPGHLQASACCKHYVANSMDNSQVAGTHWDRNHFDANITMRDLVDSYLPPFQACVEKGKASPPPPHTMPSYALLPRPSVTGVGAPMCYMWPLTLTLIGWCWCPVVLSMDVNVRSRV